MELPYFHVDAFTDQLFGGNPACVVSLPQWLPDELLLKIANENGVPETAFYVTSASKIQLRWFTPEIEMDLCGHATLATAHVLMSHLNFTQPKLQFETQSGTLEVSKVEDMYFLTLPARPAVPASLPKPIGEALNIPPMTVLKARDYVLVYESETAVRNIVIDRLKFDEINLHTGGVVVTAIGDNCDFVSRFFTPQASILEDPVTGSAHCSLVPFWAERLKKERMHARQLSKRMGDLFCENGTDHVIVGGKARSFASGTLWIS